MSRSLSCGHEARQKPDRVSHVRAVQAQHADVPAEGHALDDALPDVPLRPDPGSDGLGPERVPDHDGDAPVEQGLDGSRMEDLGAEIRELGGLVVRKRPEQLRVRDVFGRSGEKAVDVLPHLEPLGLEGVGDHGRAVVGSAAAEGDRLSVLGLPEESGDAGQNALVEQGLQGL